MQQLIVISKLFETGYSYFGARYYDSDLSVWLSRKLSGVDPLSDERPGLSPYNYCQLNPEMRVDPTGMLDDDYSVSKSEEESLFGDRSVVKKVPYSYYIFMGKSSNLYKLSSDGKKASRTKNASPSVILKIMK